MSMCLHGWRRKTAAMLLLVACVFLTGWMRSHTIEDGITFPMGHQDIDSLVSTQGEIGLVRWYDDDVLYPTWTFPFWSSMRTPPGTPSHFGDWIWCCCGVGIKGWREHRVYVVSYWSIILLTTLLATLLLFAHPRRSPNHSSPSHGG